MKSDGRIFLASRALMFAAALVFFSYTLLDMPKARAQVPVKQWVVQGAAETPNPFSVETSESGWHWNDFTGSIQLAAKDFPDYSSQWLNPILWADMSLSSGYGWHYVISAPVSCRALATVEWSDGITWTAVGGLDIHFVHLSSRNTGTTDYMQSSSDGIWWDVGTMATSGTCWQNATQAHIAAEVNDWSSGGGYIKRHIASDETCWADFIARCDTYDYDRENNDPAGGGITCDEDFGDFDISGSLAEYLACGWMENDRSQSIDVFEMHF